MNNRFDQAQEAKDDLHQAERDLGKIEPEMRHDVIVKADSKIDRLPASNPQRSALAIAFEQS